MKERFYKIASVAKSDIIAAFEGDDDFYKIKARLKKMTDKEMRVLANKMSDDYLNQLFWDSLRVSFKDRFMGVEE